MKVFPNIVFIFLLISSILAGSAAEDANFIAYTYVEDVEYQRVQQGRDVQGSVSFNIPLFAQNLTYTPSEYPECGFDLISLSFTGENQTTMYTDFDTILCQQYENNVVDNITYFGNIRFSILVKHDVIESDLLNISYHLQDEEETKMRHFVLGNVNYTYPEPIMNSYIINEFTGYAYWNEDVYTNPNYPENLPEIVLNTSKEVNQLVAPYYSVDADLKKIGQLSAFEFDISVQMVNQGPRFSVWVPTYNMPIGGITYSFEGNQSYVNVFQGYHTSLPAFAERFWEEGTITKTLRITLFSANISQEYPLDGTYSFKYSINGDPDFVDDTPVEIIIYETMVHMENGEMIISFPELVTGDAMESSNTKISFILSLSTTFLMLILFKLKSKK